MTKSKFEPSSVSKKDQNNSFQDFSSNWQSPTVEVEKLSLFKLGKQIGNAYYNVEISKKNKEVHISAQDVASPESFVNILYGKQASQLLKLYESNFEELAQKLYIQSGRLLIKNFKQDEQLSKFKSRLRKGRSSKGNNKFNLQDQKVKDELKELEKNLVQKFDAANANLQKEQEQIKNLHIATSTTQQSILSKNESDKKLLHEEKNQNSEREVSVELQFASVEENLDNKEIERKQSADEKSLEYSNDFDQSLDQNKKMQKDQETEQSKLIQIKSNSKELKRQQSEEKNNNQHIDTQQSDKYENTSDKFENSQELEEKVVRQSSNSSIKQTNDNKNQESTLQVIKEEVFEESVQQRYQQQEKAAEDRIESQTENEKSKNETENQNQVNQVKESDQEQDQKGQQGNQENQKETEEYLEKKNSQEQSQEIQKDQQAVENNEKDQQNENKEENEKAQKEEKQNQKNEKDEKEQAQLSQKNSEKEKVQTQEEEIQEDIPT